MKTKAVNVIGGGFSGLMQAFYLVEAGYQVTIFEKEKRLGGLLGSEKKQGFLIEQAANAFIANKELERVASILKVPLVEKTNKAKKRFIFRQGQMRRWPVGLGDSLPFFSFLLAKKWKNPKYAPRPQETLYNWGLRNLGPGLTDYLLEPAIRGIYASTADRLSAHLVLNSLNKKLEKGKRRGSVAAQEGMQQWVNQTKTYLKTKGAQWRVGEQCNSFDFSQPTILAMDLNSLKELCNEQKINLHPSILETQSASLTSVTLGFKDEKQKLNEGFGCLFPKKENFNALGVLFNHSIFPGRVQNQASETWILNDQNIQFSNMSEMALLRYIHSDRSQLGKVWQEPDVISVNQWPERIPLYDHALEHFLEMQKKEKPPFLLMGNYLGDLGLGKIIFHAKDNVEKIKGGYFV